MQQSTVRTGLNSFQLKVLALSLMAVDHIGAVLMPEYIILRCLGRGSFPIFCFLLTEGFFHTSNVVRYLKRLGMFAVLAEIPYDLAFHGTLLELEGQNIFFTLFLGVAMLEVLKYSREWYIKLLLILAFVSAADLLRTDYGGAGILLIAWFGLMRNKKWLKLAGGALWNLLGMTVIQLFGVFAMIPIGFYNGEKGPGMKYFFYAFYPVHLLILYVLSAYVLH